MNIIELAKECGVVTELGYGDAMLDYTTKLQAFAQAVIDDYKASLEPVAWMTKDNFFNHVKTEHYVIPLYALPKETK